MVSRKGAAGRRGLQWGSKSLDLASFFDDIGAGWWQCMDSEASAGGRRLFEWSFMDFVGDAWRMASGWRRQLHDGRS